MLVENVRLEKVDECHVDSSQIGRVQLKYDHKCRTFEHYYTSTSGLGSRHAPVVNGAVMTVKDLVQLYESSSDTNDNSPGLGQLPPPRLARFIDRPLRAPPRHVDPKPPPSSPGNSQSRTLTVSEQSNLGSGSDTQARSYPKESDDSEAGASLLQHAYPPTTRPDLFESGIALPRLESRSKYLKRPPPHRPIPATLLFARHAYPLNLPNLDRYISSLVPPVFSKGKDCEGNMFPPLDKLESTGSTLDDLENNTKIPHAWRDRTGILWTMVSFFIDILVCTTSSYNLSPANNRPRDQVLLHHFIACRDLSIRYKSLH